MLEISIELRNFAYSCSLLEKIYFLLSEVSWFASFSKHFKIRFIEKYLVKPDVIILILISKSLCCCTVMKAVKKNWSNLLASPLAMGLLLLVGLSLSVEIAFQNLSKEYDRSASLSITELYIGNELRICRLFWYYILQGSRVDRFNLFSINKRLMITLLAYIHSSHNVKFLK